MRISRFFYLMLGMCLAMTSKLVAENKPELHTYVYKTVGELKIHADVYRYQDAKQRPAVVWIHGGALINGHRAGVSSRVKQMALDNGYVLISLDYRLAPETQLPEIIADIEDAFRWLRREGPKLFHIDPSRIAVTGGSAGGYLTLITGHRVKPRPRVLVAFWGYGDLVGDWYSQPSPHPRHHRIKTTRENAWKQVNGPAISDSRLRKGDGGMFYQYCRQTGAWPKAVTGWDSIKEAKKFHPYMPVKNVNENYPPTVLVHGTADTDVPFEQSVLMDRELTKHKVSHEFLRIEGGEHGLAGGDPQEIDAAYKKAFQFLKQALD
ncbi:MAG: alpha/beta hydrolase [Planctomycetaceae bacterium]|nr:alpha/beta hydrolase [Planctomycetaceae bacterium]